MTDETVVESEHPQLPRWAKGVVHLVRPCSICSAPGPFLVAEQSYCPRCCKEMLKELVAILDLSDGDKPAVPAPEVLARPVEELMLSVRSYNTLKDAHLETVGAIVAERESSLLKIKGFGKKSLKEIKEMLAGMDLTLKP